MNFNIPMYYQQRYCLSRRHSDLDEIFYKNLPQAYVGQYIIESVIFRFPWPQDDNKKFDVKPGFGDYKWWSYDFDNDKTLVFTVPDKIINKLIHSEIKIEKKYCNNKFSFYIVCPLCKSLYDKGIEVGCIYSDPIEPAIRIVGESYYNNNPYTIFCCAYCRDLFSANNEEILEIKSAICKYGIDTNDEEYCEKIANRIYPYDYDKFAELSS